MVEWDRRMAPSGRGVCCNTIVRRGLASLTPQQPTWQLLSVRCPVWDPCRSSWFLQGPRDGHLATVSFPNYLSPVISSSDRRRPIIPGDAARVDWAGNLGYKRATSSGDHRGGHVGIYRWAAPLPLPSGGPLYQTPPDRPAFPGDTASQQCGAMLDSSVPVQDAPVTHRPRATGRAGSRSRRAVRALPEFRSRPSRRKRRPPPNRPRHGRPYVRPVLPRRARLFDHLSGHSAQRL